ncbi:MAG: type III-B CRISPR module RAMP protein Cmr4, partial [Caldimicrobium sp.]
LFTMEFVPSEAIFYSFVFFIDRVKDGLDAEREFEELFENNNLVLQFGGDETIGAGFTKVRFKKLNSKQPVQSS